MKRAQVTIDFIVVLAIVMTIFLVFLNTITTRQKSLVDYRVGMAAKDLSLEIAREINAVYLSGDNASKNITFPLNLRGGKKYGKKIGRRRSFPYYILATFLYSPQVAKKDLLLEIC